MTILVVGSVAYDDIITPFTSRKQVLGGSATYFSLAGQHFSQTQIVAVVGDDFRDEDRQMMASRGINLDGLETAPGKTFYWKGEYLPKWNERITHDTQLNVFEHFHPKIPASHRQSEFVFLGNIAPSLQLDVLNQMERPKLVAMDSMNLWINIAREELTKVLAKIDILLINDEEALLLSEKEQLVEAAKAILEMGPRVLCIKQGEHGAALFMGNRIFMAPAYPKCVVTDPTGAGDSFAGGFMGYLTKTPNLDFENLKKAVIYGSVMGSFAVESFSVTRLSAVSDEDIVRRYMEFVEMTHFHQ